MVDDRGSPLSSEEMLRAAREGAGSSSEPVAGEGESAVDDGGERGAGVPDQGDASLPSVLEGRTRWLRRTGRLVETGRWWQRLKKRDFDTMLKNRDFEMMVEDVPGAQSRRFDLIVDGEQAGWVATEMATDHVGFSKVSQLRTTRVRFDDGTVWSISVESPGPKETKTTTFGKVKEVPHRIHRRVLVLSDGQRRLAWTEGDVHLDKRASSRVTSEGGTYELLTPRRMDRSAYGGAREGRIGDSAVVRRSGPPWAQVWTIDATAALPLPVALLHWHLLVGDWLPESTG